MKILVKFPTRERPEKFFNVLQKYYSTTSDSKNTHYVISMDTDDVTMNNEEVQNKLRGFRNLHPIYSYNRSKIQAVNSAMDRIQGWDIVLLASDDMVPVLTGWDDIIRQDMKDHFPDTDGVLWYPDGHRDDLITLSILGKKYYDRFGYLYHPSYQSLWADNEFMEVCTSLGRVYKSDKVIIEHQHPAYGAAYDRLYAKNDSFSSLDQKNFEFRKQNNFPK